MFSVTSVLAGCKASISAAGSLQESKSFLAFHGAGRGGKVTCFDMFFVFFLVVQMVEHLKRFAFKRYGLNNRV